MTLRYFVLGAGAAIALAGCDQAARDDAVNELENQVARLESQLEETEAASRAALQTAEQRVRDAAQRIDPFGDFEGVDLTFGIDAEPGAQAEIIDAEGEVVGQALIWPATDGILLRVAIDSVPRGFHGLHFHATGLCEPGDGFASADGHIMPSGDPHGFLNPQGPHEGNLPNIFAHANELAVLEVYSTLVTVSEGEAALLDEDGSTLIIHTNVDDHFSQPIGGAGARIACGVIEPVVSAE